MEYIFYGADCETTGLDFQKHNIIELSLYRLTDDVQKTWLIKPVNPENIDTAALRINGHKREDLVWETKYGRETYRDPNKVIVEVENWLAEDDVPTSNRCLVGHNVQFDKLMMESMWSKCQAADSFPFGRRYLDTMTAELLLSYAKGEFDEGYGLANLTKKYGVKNERAHSAAADTKAAVEVFRKQADLLRKLLKK